jgi:dihydrofolate synthase/folylpolyglutamate synthase
MNYHEAVRYLLALGGELAAPRQPAPVAKFDLRNITVLAHHLGDPHLRVPCAHIAGTNGKGSTAAMLESILRHAGPEASQRTGLYTSPHLERINERIAVNGEPISDADFAAAFTRVHHAIEELLASGPEASGLAAHPTFFECVTAMAFDHFARCAPSKGCHPERSEGSAFPFESATGNADFSPASGLGMTSGEAGAGGKVRVDFAIYEVGMGGRLDSTNIVAPEVCIITQIDFDHENYLGHSIEQIAAEKAGILKPGVPVVCAAGRPEARAVIARRAAEVGCPFVDVEADYRFEDQEARNGRFRATLVDQRSRWCARLEPPLAGRFQLRNAASAAVAARILATSGFHVDERAIAIGVQEVHWPGRMEQLQRNPVVYLDGAHNPAGAQQLREFWQDNFRGRRVILVYGAVRDKAVDEIIGWLFHAAWIIIYTEPRTTRAISAKVLANIAPPYGGRRVEVIPEPEAALSRALELAQPHDVVFATGSLYLVGDLRRAWRAQHPAPIST